MAQVTERITFTVPKELADRINEAAKSESCSRSEFLRKASWQVLAVQELHELSKYGAARAKELGIRPEDVDDLIHEYRAEVAASQE